MILHEQELYKGLARAMDELKIIDTHEHLHPESVRTGQQVDFTTLFSHYCLGDMLAAGLSPKDADLINNSNTDLEVKWELFKPYYDLIKNGSYALAARISMEYFYGVYDLVRLDDAIDVTERMRAENKPGIYSRILYDVCNLGACFVFTNEGMDLKDQNFYSVDVIDHFCYLTSYRDYVARGEELGCTKNNLQAYVDALGEFIGKKAQEGIKGLKFTCAYYRSLDFPTVSNTEAESIFNKLFAVSNLVFNNPKSLQSADVFKLQNYLIHRVLEFCQEHGLPAVFHTGIQAGVHNNPANANPLPLWNLAYQFRNVKFILLHSGLPWTDEAALLAKSFPNVFLDLAWTHIISPTITRNTLKTLMDMVPRNKIMAFGGDYSVPEKVYGHLVMAKENIGTILTELVLQRRISEEDAYAWMQAILRDNAITIYDLKL